ncbi:MAG TPA: response regulator [Microvirga sp.]|jgi:CheY-like chemotaxis protein|nr:response regulator [Microvirga sp.]
MSAPLRVLVVEDETMIADYIADVLEEAGHEVVGIAATGAKAIEFLDELNPDAVLLDITLKGSMNGIAVAEVARTRGVPHLFISGSGDPLTRAAADATQPLGFLQKPFKPDDLGRFFQTLTGDQQR